MTDHDVVVQLYLERLGSCFQFPHVISMSSRDGLGSPDG